MEWTFDAELWLWKADAAWHFITLPEYVSDEIEDVVVERRGFGSLRVEARIGESQWSTSIFPSKEIGSFLLPVKKAVRAAEGLSEGARCTVQVTLVDIA